MKRYLQHAAAAIVAISLGLYVIYLRMPSSEFTNPHFPDGNHTFQPGQLICLHYTVRRLDSCTLDIKRYLEDEDRKETLIQSQMQLIKPGPPRPSQFTPCPEVPSGMKPGKYKLFPRLRYFCNWLDYGWPRIVDFESVPIIVVP